MLAGILSCRKLFDRGVGFCDIYFFVLCVRRARMHVFLEHP